MTCDKSGLSVKAAIAARGSVRAFTGEPLSEETLTELFEAARLAPSSLNSQPWRFKTVTSEADRQWLASREVTRKQGWLATAPAIVVCCADLTGYVKDSQASAFFYRQGGLLDEEVMTGIEAYVVREESAPEAARFGAAAMNVGLAVSFLMLRAVELGLGTCWVGMFDERLVKERFGLGEGLRVVCLLAVGRPAGAVKPGARKSLAEILLP